MITITDWEGRDFFNNMELELSIIIINWNTRELLNACLASIYANSPVGKFEVIVTDNGSIDDSVEMIKGNFPLVKLIENENNLGFGKANNQGIKIARGKYVCLLNSDTLIEHDVFTPILRWMERHPKVGITGPRLNNKDGSLQPSVGYLPNLIGLLTHQALPLHAIWFVNRFLPTLQISYSDFYRKVRPVGWVKGACMVIRKSVIEKIGGLDEAIFMYGEEVEFCKRAWDQGWEVWLIPDVSVWHLDRGSSTNGKRGAILGIYRGIYYYYRKHHPHQLGLVVIIMRLGAVLRLLKSWSIYSEALKINPESL